MSSQGKLIVLPPSHFCERARWALQHMSIPFEEERWVAGLHISLAKKIAPGTSLPIFVTQDDDVIQGSGEILDFTGMNGGDPTVEARMETGIGVLARVLIYSGTIHNPKSGIREVLLDGVSTRQAMIGRLMWPITRRLMARGMNARPARIPEITQQIETELAWLDERIGDSPYLVGETFGRADLTVASLMSPLLGTRGQKRGKRVILPPEISASLASWADRPAMRFALRMYADHRSK